MGCDGARAALQVGRGCSHATSGAGGPIRRHVHAHSRRCQRGGLVRPDAGQHRVYANEQADAAAEAYWKQQNGQQTTVTTGSYQTDGVDLPTNNQRALDAFLGPAAAQGGTAIGGAPSTDGAGTSGRTYLDPADAEQHRRWGFTVLTDDNGQAYLPPQAGYDVSVQAPPLTVLPGVGHSGPSTAPPAAARPDHSPSPGSTPSNTDGVDPVNDVKQPAQSPPIESPLGKAVDDLLNLSPTLREKWAAAKKVGWQIELIEGDKRSYTDSKARRVYINLADITPGGDQAAKGARLLAHEIGHAVTDFLGTQNAATKPDFVAINTQLALEYEGAAAFENARARDEIIMSGGKDIEIRGGLDGEYDAIYQQYKWGGISEAEAKAQMTAVMAREPEESATRSTTRAEAFAEYYAGRWDSGERTDD